MPVSVNQALANIQRLTDPAGLIPDYGRGSYGKADIAGRPLRYAYNLDGLDDRWTLANRGINVEQDIDIEFYTPSNIGNTGFDRVILSQCLSGTFSSREFDLLISGSGALAVNIGGTVSTLAFSGTFSAQEKLRVLISGSTATTYRANGEVIRTFSITRGTAREPLAQTTIGARFNGTAYSNFSQGIQRDIKINGTLWPIADRNQTIQLPTPSGLGAELITSNEGWFTSALTSFSGGVASFNTGTQAIVGSPANPSVVNGGSYYVEFEVFDYVSGQVRANFYGNGQAFVGAYVSGNGVYRVFGTISAAGTALTNRLGLQCGTSGANLKIKNISFKPLGTCNPMTGTNLNPDRWVEIPV